MASSLSLKKDSTLAMIASAQRRGWEVLYIEQGDLFFDGMRPAAIARKIVLSTPFADHHILPEPGEAWHSLADPQRIDLADCDVSS